MRAALLGQMASWIGGFCFWFCLLAPAFAQSNAGLQADDIDDSVFERGCGDDRGQDRCDAQMQQEMRALYGWETAEKEVKAGVQFRRFMMVDGYGRDVLAITFERRPGMPPRVRVDIPRVKEEDQIFANRPGPKEVDSPLQAELGSGEWERALSLTKNFDQSLTRELEIENGEEKGEENTISICLHGWFTVVEAGDPSGPETPVDQSIRSDAESACDKGLAMPTSFQLADLAIQTLSVCRDLDPENYRNAIMMLNACRWLGGDRVAAAKALDLVRELKEADDKASTNRFQSLFVRGAEEEAVRLSDWIGEKTVYWGLPYAQDARHAILRGYQSETLSETDQSQTARYQDIALYLEKPGFVWRVASFELGETRTITDSYDD